MNLEQLAQELFWDDLEIGARYSTASRTITETDVVTFAALTGDFNRLHVDAEYAKTTHFGQRIAHGLLVASVSAGLNTRTVVNQFIEHALLGLLETELTFKRPTFLGDTISVSVEVVELKETSRKDRGVAVFRRTTTNQRKEAVLEVRAVMMVRRRPDAMAGRTIAAMSGVE